ncbi:dihydroorotase family protein [Paenibacillus sp. HWE-109]|uniref:dihydroorotase n=1 Tax=Paenibacillus sp. HWE-109 TaxID=1306526 RepID=UPI001EDD8E96|nr:dihydroorotase family protein [Paenibacillus sp. HWE-109]UKS29363.1 dihydroorotase family protein [Paenibacillus sp. HWE-109]
MKVDLAIRGNIVLPDCVLNNSIIGIENGVVVYIGDHNDILEAGEYLDASGKLVLPGAIDAHVHCYSSMEEGVGNLTRAAAAGGVTTIIEMPYNASGIICTAQLLSEKKEWMEQESVVDFALLATIQKEGSLDEIYAMAEAGACGFYVSMFNNDSTSIPRIDDGRLLDAFSIIAETELPVGVHCEVDEIIRAATVSMAPLGGDPRAHCWSRPKIAESIAANTVMELALLTGVKLHLFQCTFPEIFDSVQYYAKLGADVTAETCTHYLIFHEDDMLRLGAKGKINPPLRQAIDAEGLWTYLASGRISMVTSDHASWKLDRKSSRDIFQNASGVPGIESLLPILYSSGVATGVINLHDFVRVISQSPADRFGLGKSKGRLTVGYDADIVIFDPEAQWRIDESEEYSSAGWSLYHDMIVKGRIERTYVRGQLVYDGKEVLASAYGRFVKGSYQAKEWNML